mmetsp:Transcript_14953/g.21747  ORF Transcript_14953/g.21747 Transcript_14953/m.21747 type:complete len:102 (+) Transcript_14953:16-321(+)
MDKEQEVVLLPDGELALATKVKPAEKAHLICWSCKTHLLYEKDAETVKCSVCGSLNGTSIFPADQPFIVYKCGSCGTFLRAPANCLAICCASCRSISILTR